MAPSLQEIQDLYNRTEYREVIAAVDEWRRENPNEPLGAYEAQKAWAHYQLGEYQAAESLALLVSGVFGIDASTRESAFRCAAHCAVHYGKDLQQGDELLRELPPSLPRDNVRMNLIIEGGRKGLAIPAGEVMAMITNALRTVPYQTINGHLVNNGCLALYESRNQQDVQPYLPAIVGLIESALAIYEATNTAKNHIAGALFRASNIFLDVAGWKEGARMVAQESIATWERLVASQGGERYQRNLQGARQQLARVEAAIAAG